MIVKEVYCAYFGTRYYYESGQVVDPSPSVFKLLKRIAENLEDLSEEQEERFHQDIDAMERHYQGRQNVNMIADHCWMLQRTLRIMNTGDNL
ncbi:hypothetical protein PYW08_001679 [Mythimna loreyi]|uniref:Uncharacterized protein n=1 Tax=Mythimna loreyi TaxID=667449 RepID=A0ACC2R5B7_9NEOP|nr:hypothetical protein PYW08_001679 [Mythimna loreyi]